MYACLALLLWLMTFSYSSTVIICFRYTRSHSLGWRPEETLGAPGLSRAADTKITTASSCFVPVASLLARHATAKQAKQGITSMWANRCGSHLLCFDGDTLVQLKLPPYADLNAGFTCLFLKSFHAWLQRAVHRSACKRTRSSDPEAARVSKQ